MGYNIKIGNAEPLAEEGRFLWRIEEIELDEAPSFINDDVTGQSNCRCPSYSGWAGFCQETGLHELFLEPWSGLMSEHPGIVPITEEHHTKISKALDKFNNEHPTTTPGFGHEPHNPHSKPWDGIDPHSGCLARLIWLEWWFRWALDNCKHPAIQNS